MGASTNEFTDAFLREFNSNGPTGTPYILVKEPGSPDELPLVREEDFDTATRILLQSGVQISMSAIDCSAEGSRALFKTSEPIPPEVLAEIHAQSQLGRLALGA